MTTQHTPGPWKITYFAVTDADYQYIINGAKTSKDDAHANARLIAAAPTLLSAARMALETIKHAALEEFDIPQEYLEKAIARAEGREE